MLGVEPTVEVVRPRPEQPSPKNARRARQVADVDVEHRVELTAGIAKLEAPGDVAIALQFAVGIARRGIVGDPIVTRLDQARRAEREAVADRQIDRRLAVDRVVGSPGPGRIARHLVGIRLGGIDLYDACRGVAPEQRALRTTKNLDALQIEHWKRLQHRVLERDIVVDDRDGLRGVGIEIGVAEPADVKARKGPAERGFNLKARRPTGEKADVETARVEHVELLTADRSNREWHVLRQFLTTSSSDDDLANALIVRNRGLRQILRNGGGGG